jgi:4-amino-4-deoxy-L-arabinose transferase-like glycosyltransferase
MSTELNVSTPAAPAPAGGRLGLRPRARLQGVSARLESRYAKAIVGVFACLALMLAWNVAHYPAGVSPDASDHFKYTDSIRYHHALPKPEHVNTKPGTRAENTGQWYNPPLFYTVAAGIEAATDTVTNAAGLSKKADRSHKAVQLFNVLLALGVALLAFLIARELFPRSKIAQVAVLGFVALSPTFVRTAVVYHGQMLATLFSTAALYVVIRALVRHQVTVKAGLLAGVLLALGMLTRHFVIATTAALVLSLGAYWLFTRRGDALRMAGVLVLSVVVLTSPWYIHQQVRYGNAFVASAKQPDKPFFSRQPSSFYFGKPRTAAFTQPYRPKFDNRFPQVSYADWWGDYFLYYDVPSSLRLSQVVHGGRLPGRYHSERVRQSWIGVLPTILIAIGLAGLLWYGIRRRAPHLLAMPILVGVVALEAVWVYLGYPTSDGDIMRATYLLTALPAAAVALGWVLMRLRERSTAAFGVVVGVLGVSAVVELPFLVLHHMVGGGA